MGIVAQRQNVENVLRTWKHSVQILAKTLPVEMVHAIVLSRVIHIADIIVPIIHFHQLIAAQKVHMDACLGATMRRFLNLFIFNFNRL